MLLNNEKLQFYIKTKKMIGISRFILELYVMSSVLYNLYNSNQVSYRLIVNFLISGTNVGLDILTMMHLFSGFGRKITKCAQNQIQISMLQTQSLEVKSKFYL
uniref:Uncharacterized protein n=1 Tax=Glossina palpalis gambiensis TaxID=67801 RepID=A0A1B0C387_9MUSC